MMGDPVSPERLDGLEERISDLEGDRTRPVSRFPVLRFFSSGHLPEELQAVAEPFEDLACRFAHELQKSDHPAEVATGLRKLLEAKDCFVRASLSS